MVKKILFLSAFLISLSCAAQRFAFVNTNSIMEQIPAYQVAQEELNKIANEYKKEIDLLKKQVNDLLYAYQADKILLTDEMQLKREVEINQKKIELDKVKQQRFGENGDLYVERQKLVKPIQDKVFEAIKEVAEKGNFNLILDVSSDDLAILYYDEKYDKTKDVLKKLGY